MSPPRQAAGFRATKRDKAPHKIYHVQAIFAPISSRSPTALRTFRGPFPRRPRSAREPSEPRRKPWNGKNLSAGSDPGPARPNGKAGQGDLLFAAGAGLALRDACPARGSARRRRSARPPGLAERRRFSKNPARQRRRSRAARSSLRHRRPARARGRPLVALARRRRPAAQPRPEPGFLTRRRGSTWPVGLDGLATSLKTCAGQGDPVSAASKSCDRGVFRLPGRPVSGAEILALWAFDIILAIRLRWPRPVPLIAVKILDPPAAIGRRPTTDPNDPAWPEPPQARSHSPPPPPSTSPPSFPPSNTLIAVAPKLRSKPMPRNRRPHACAGLRLARRSGPPHGYDRPRRPPAVRPSRAPRCRARIFRAGRRSGCSAYDAAARRRQRGGDESLDVELIDLPPAARWREWMLRVEAAVFASAPPALFHARRSSAWSAKPAGSTISSPISSTSCAGALRSHPRRRRLCAENQNSLRPGHPRRPSWPRGTTWPNSPGPRPLR